MKTLISFFTCFLLFLGVNAKAQQKGILYYKLTIKEVSAPQHIVNYVTYFNNNSSIEFAVPKKIKEGTVQSGENSVIKTVVLNTNDNRKPFVYKDFNKNTLTAADFISFKK